PRRGSTTRRRRVVVGRTRGGFEARERLLRDHTRRPRTHPRLLRSLATLVSVAANAERARDVDRRVYDASVSRHEPRRRRSAHGARAITATWAFTRHRHGARLR